MKKTRVAILLVVMLVFGAMALGSGSDSDKKDITAGSEAMETEDGEAVNEAAGEDGDSENTDSEEVGDSDTSDSEMNGDSGDASKTTTEIESQVLLEADGLKITAEEYVTDSFWGDGIKMLIENDGTGDIGIGCTALIVNDYMITDLFSDIIAAGKKSYETLYLSSNELEAAGIENVGKIELYFHTYDPDSYMTIQDFDCITIETSDIDSMDSTVEVEGYELYNEDGIRIVGQYVDENSFWGAAVLLYIENNSGKNRIIQCEDISINGFMVTPIFSSTVYDGKKAIDEITLFSSDLEENNITSVDEIELKFDIMDENFMNSKETDVISFSAK